MSHLAFGMSRKPSTVFIATACLLLVGFVFLAVELYIDPGIDVLYFQGTAGESMFEKSPSSKSSPPEEYECRMNSILS